MIKKSKYNRFLHTRAGKIWQKIGIHRRSGVVVPLFSVYSHDSIGIGEFPDLKMIIEWCVKTGMSIIQLLPLNETGNDFAPYNAISSFAIEPMYLRLNELNGVDPDKYKASINSLKKQFASDKRRVDYNIKHEKLKLLWKIYSKETPSTKEFQKYIKENKYWLKDYAVFKILKENNSGKPWEEWKNKSINHQNSNIKNRVMFSYWLQWQIYEQMKDVKDFAKNNGVLLMGDLPFLSARDSADAWAHQKYFKLNLSAGAPPDMYFAFGQKWGMPPYNWNIIEKDNYVYIKEKLKYAENFYDLYRIDHLVGLFRLWTFETSDEGSESKRKGNFDPPEKTKWEKHGKKIINVMINSSKMLPCGEDLGTVPECSYRTLKEYGIPGIDFQRFNKDKKHNFISGNNYRLNSSAVISTHDSSFFPLWWQFEAGTIDKQLFEYHCRANDIKGKKLKDVLKRLFDKNKSHHGRLFWNKNITKTNLLDILKLNAYNGKEIIKLYEESFREKEKFIRYLYGKNKSMGQSSPQFQLKCLEAVNKSASIFSIQLIHEYLFLEKKSFGKMNIWDYRINQPGSGSRKNWSVRVPLSIESLLKEKSLIKKIRGVNTKSHRT